MEQYPVASIGDATSDSGLLDLARVSRAWSPHHCERSVDRLTEVSIVDAPTIDACDG